MSLMRIEGVAHSFGERTVLRGVQLDVRPGEVMGLVGRNGAGKSTLAAIIAGRVEPDEGAVTVAPGGVPVDGHPVSIIEQGLGLDPSLSVVDTLFRNLVDAVPDGEERRRNARSLLMRFGFAVGLDDPVGGLDRWEQGMVEAVRLLLEGRPVTIVDEVTAELTPREVDELHYVVKKLIEDDRSVVYITHRLGEALTVCDRVAVLADGLISEVVDSRTTTVEQLTEALVGEPLPVVARVAHTEDRLRLSVRGLDCGGDPIDLDVFGGETLALVGDRSSGISALIGALSGDAPRPMARLTVAGRFASIKSPEDAVALRIGYLAGGANEFEVTPEESVARGMLMDGVSESAEFDDELAAVMAMLATMAEADAAAQRRTPTRPHLSPGQALWRQLQSVVADSGPVVVLDEPMRGLDVKARHDLGVLLGETRASGKGIVLATTDPEDVLALADRVAFLVNGSLRSVYDVDDLSLDQVEEGFHGHGPHPR